MANKNIPQAIQTKIDKISNDWDNFLNTDTQSSEYMEYDELKTRKTLFDFAIWLLEYKEKKK